MAQRHLYGIDYEEKNPPVEWGSISVDATINDSAIESTINTGVFTWNGEVAEWIKKTWIPTYGLFNGVPYRIEMQSEKTGASTIVFDGFIRLSDREILSRSEPCIFTAPVEELNNKQTVFDRLSIVTQGLLKQRGFLTPLDSIDVPVIKESKKNIAERGVILGQLGYSVVNDFIAITQNFLSAVSDTIGLSAPVGIIEFATWAINTVITAERQTENVLEHRDLLFPPVVYYKGLNIKKPLEAAAAYLGYTIDFGEIDDFLSNVYLLPSQNQNTGFPIPGIIGDGTLKIQDDGYLISELMATLEKLCYTRRDVNGTVIHFKNRLDPYWTTSPELVVDPTRVEQTAQYQNGFEKEDVERVPAVVYMTYAFDNSDTWTLTEKNGDSYEIHRRLITELDPRMNTLKGLQEINIPYAMAVRKTPFDNLFDLFTGITDEFDFWLNQLKLKIDEVASFLPPGIDIGSIIDFPLLGSFLENRTGALKIDDDTFGTPKILWMEPNAKGELRIPENFKDFIGMEAIYNRFRLSDSPADVNDFGGQYVLRNDWKIRFNYEDYVTIKENPYYEFESLVNKFKLVSWVEDGNFAITESEQNRIFDTNITEEPIN